MIAAPERLHAATDASLREYLDVHGIEGPPKDPGWYVVFDEDGDVHWLAREGVPRPRLYRVGFAHNNCGGGCCKAGQAQFGHLYRTDRDVYDEWEEEETDLRELLGDVSILRDRRGGGSKPLPLSVFRQRLEAGAAYDLFEFGGCGCFIDDNDAVQGDLLVIAEPR